MTELLSKADELRQDLENLYFSCRYYIGILAELEQLGRTHTEDFKRIERNVNTLKNNIKRLEKELEAEEQREFDEAVDEYDFSDGMHW